MLYGCHRDELLCVWGKYIHEAGGADVAQGQRQGIRRAQAEALGKGTKRHGICHRDVCDLSQNKVGRLEGSNTIWQTGPRARPAPCYMGVSRARPAPESRPPRLESRARTRGWTWERGRTCSALDAWGHRGQIERLGVRPGSVNKPKMLGRCASLDFPSTTSLTPTLRILHRDTRK